MIINQHIIQVILNIFVSLNGKEFQMELKRNFQI